MTSRSYGRQYPDGPLEAPPGWPALTLEIPADPEMVPEHFYDDPPWAPVPEGAGGFVRIELGDSWPPGYPKTSRLCQCSACMRERCEP